MDAPTVRAFLGPGTVTLNADYGAEHQRGNRLFAPDFAWFATHTVFMSFQQNGGRYE
jgi:hypothetical protein